MSTRSERKKRAQRSLRRHCLKCGEEGPHYIGPSFGDPGIWICQIADPAPETSEVEG